MKQAMNGKLALMPAITRLMDEVMSGPVEREERDSPLQQEFAMLVSAKKLFLFIAGAATQTYQQQLADQQEVMGAIADIVIEIFAMESALLRAEKMSAKSVAAIPVAMAGIYASAAMDRIELAGRRVIAGVAEGDALQTQSAILRRLAKHDFTNTIGLRRQVAQHVIHAGKYAL